MSPNTTSHSPLCHTNVWSEVREQDFWYPPPPPNNKFLHEILHTDHIHDVSSFRQLGSQLQQFLSLPLPMATGSEEWLKTLRQHYCSELQQDTAWQLTSEGKFSWKLTHNQYTCSVMKRVGCPGTFWPKFKFYPSGFADSARYHASGSSLARDWGIVCGYGLWPHQLILSHIKKLN